MTPLTALVIGVLVAILYWFVAALPIQSAVKQIVAGIFAVAVFVLLLAVVRLVHL